MNSKHRIPVILDGDPGHDDAIAWTLANASSELEILAVTSVAGNQTIEKTTYNALRVCTLLGLHVPVGMGSPRPLFTEPMNAPSVHGESGLDGPELPEPDFEASSERAVQLMARVIQESKEKVTLVSTGPMTNIASLILSHPELLRRIERLSMMGGGIQYGNWTPAAEFNVLVDPEAARIVFESGIPIWMAGLDVTEKALILPEDVDRIRNLHNPVSDIVWQWLEFFSRFHKGLGYEGAPMHDPCAVMALLHPEIFEIESYYVQVETCGDYCRGATIADRNGILGHKPNAHCIMDVDRERFVSYLVKAIEQYGEVSK